MTRGMPTGGAGPLAHVRVVELTDIRGAFAGRLLADLGADVLKVESPSGDPGRLRAPFAGGTVAADRSLPFLYRNANKRGVTVDLHDADGWHRFLELCTRADVLIENLGPAAARRHGLAPDEVQARHPHLVHVAISDFGSDGPHAGWCLEPLPAFAASGGLFACGFKDLPPCWLPGYLAHDCASTFAVAGAVAALLDRARSGLGQTVEVSVQEAAINGIHPWTIPVTDYARRYPMLPVAPPRNADGAYHVLAVSDGWVRVLPGSPRQWRAFVELLGKPEALTGPEWEVPLFRLMNGDVIRLIAADALASRTQADVLAAGRRLDVPLVAVNRPERFVVEEQTMHRDFFRRTGFPVVGDAPMAPGPFSFSVTPTSLRRPAPAPVARDAEGFPPRPAPVPRGGAREPVLAGVRVVDLGVGVAVPEGGWLLAELGAEVVKIESRTNLDFLRRVTVEPDQPDRSMQFNDSSRGHLGVAVDLSTARGRELALDLCAAADVVLENNRGGVVQRWGLDYPAVRARRPDVIYYASQAFGRGGPLAEASAYGPLNSAFAGLTWLWNFPDAPYPGGSSLNHPDHLAAKLAAAVILAALEHRRVTGEGQLIEMSQAEAAAYYLGEVYLEQTCTGRPAAQRGNAVEWACPHGVYPSAGEDRWVAIAVADDEAWRRCVRVLGLPDDSSLATVAGRLAARAAVDEAVASWTRGRDAGEATRLLQEAGVSAMAVMSGADLREDPHLAARGSIVTVVHPEMGEERHSGNPLRFSRTPVSPSGPAPLLGQHTADVLRRWLGMSQAAVTELLDIGVSR
jgi:crotonobetainyl-CoA:carnitine CoA-transferase CaiB-like acyl-CoA transferase